METAPAETGAASGAAPDPALDARTGRTSQGGGAGYGGLARRLQGLNLYLVGMMGAGKSSVGRPLAEALGYRFLDADAVLEQAAGRSIAAIFAEEGEEAFRSLETTVLDRLAGWHSLVVATGGGVVSRPENWGHLRQGVVIWLDASEELLLHRLRTDPTPRPLLADADPAARLAALLTARRPLYAQADLTIPQAGESPAEVAEQVLAALPTILRPPQPPPPEASAVVDEGGRIRREINTPARPAGPEAPAAPQTNGS
jgi:shikimate kinase